MKIGFFTDFYRPQINGVSSSVEIFREELEALGHEVFVFAPRPSLRYHESDEHIIRFPAIKGLFFEDYLTSLFFPPQVIRKIEKLNLDIVHYHTPSQVGLLGVFFATHHSTPLVTTYHTDLYNYIKYYPAGLPGIIVMSLTVPAIINGTASDYRQALSSIKPGRTIERWNQRLIERSLTVIHNVSDLVIVPSLKMEKQLIGWRTTTPIKILPTGISRIPTAEDDKRWYQKRLKAAKDSQVILYVGRLAKEKDLGLLIQALPIIIEGQPNASLVLAGKGPDKKELIELAKSLNVEDHITFLGQVERHRLGAVYQNAAVFAFPSQTDTQGLVLNEAAAAGLPIVLTDRDVNEVAEIGQNALVAKPTPKDLATKVLSILDDQELRARMSKASLEIASDLQPIRQAEKLIDLYQEAIIRHRQKVRPVKKPWFIRKDP